MIVAELINKTLLLISCLLSNYINVNKQLSSLKNLSLIIFINCDGILYGISVDFKNKI